jgi:predicted dehydrogenase
MMIKIGVIGAGNIAHRFSEAVQKGKTGGLLEAIASRDILKAKDYQNKYGYKKAYGDYQSLYEDPDIDLVYVATPHAFHYQQMMDLLDYGKHIICEKSFTLNANQAKAVFDKAKEKNLFVMEAMWTRFLPTVKEVLQVIDQGLIGKVHYLEANFCINAKVNQYHRLRNPKLGGGALLDLGIYPLTFSRLILGHPRDVSVDCKLDPKTGVDLGEEILLEYEGARAKLKASMIESLPMTAHIKGEDGYIIVDGFFQSQEARVYNKEGQMIKLVKHPFLVNGFEYEIQSAIDAIDKGLIENPMMPHAETLYILGQMDQIREKMGVSYPSEKEGKTYG